MTLPLVKNSAVLPREKTHHSYRSSSEQSHPLSLALNPLSVYLQYMYIRFICADPQFLNVVHCHAWKSYFSFPKWVISSQRASSHEGTTWLWCLLVTRENFFSMYILVWNCLEILQCEKCVVRLTCLLNGNTQLWPPGVSAGHDCRTNAALAPEEKDLSSTAPSRCSVPTEHLCCLFALCFGCSCWFSATSLDQCLSCRFHLSTLHRWRPWSC